MTSTGFFSRHGNIKIYVPNIIGYLRILFACLAFIVAPNHPYATVVLYFSSFVCDAVDGAAARKFNQTSTLGAVLDMLTDRLSTTGLLVLLCLQCPAWYLLWLGLIFLDIFSHWVQMYSSLAAGDISHKQSFNENGLVRFYYSTRWFMGLSCISCEVLFLALYLLSWQTKVVDVLHAVSSTPMLQKGGNERSNVVTVIAVLAVPGTVIKQLINIAQLFAACQALIVLDQQRDKSEKAKQ